MNKKEFIENSIRKMEAAGVTSQEIMDFLLQRASAKQRLPYVIVYEDDRITKNLLEGKEIKGIIFTLESKKVFISAHYAPGKMSKQQSARYCISIKLKGDYCSEGAVEHWRRDGLLYCYLEQINDVMKDLRVEPIDDRVIWSSSISMQGYWWTVNPVSGGSSWSSTGILDVRPILFLE